MLVTGGAGFIGSNFVLQTLARESGVGRLVNLDLLTYAGNPSNLTTAEFDPRYVFVRGDIGDRELVADLLTRYEITDVANFAAYLADLFMRASEAVECEVPHVIDRVSEHLAS